MPGQAAASSPGATNVLLGFMQLFGAATVIAEFISTRTM